MTTDTLREAVAAEACVYDKTGREIMRGDVVKVLHFTDERGHKRYMYKQCLGPGTYRSGKHQYVMFSHLNFIEDPSLPNGPYHEYPGAHLPHYEIVQSIDAKWRDRSRASPRLDATVRSGPDLDTLLKQSVERVKAMSPAEREAMYAEQRASFVRAMAPCEHGVRDWEDCDQCRDAVRSGEEG